MTNAVANSPDDCNHSPFDPVSEVFFAAVDRAVEFAGPRLARHSFSKVSHHAMRLLEDAMIAYRARSFGTAVFLAVTSIEEVAKAEMAFFRRGPAKPDVRIRSDPLFNHKAKHVIGVRPTTFMGKLREILGIEACKRLQTEAQSGALMQLREAALYSSLDEVETTIPAEVIWPERAREILLLALEVADDVLVGYNSETFIMGEQLSLWIAELVRGSTPA